MSRIFLVAVGVTGLALAGIPSAQAQRWSPEAPLAVNQSLQDALTWTGHYEGLIDGALGERSVAAISAFQREQGWSPTGDLTPQQKLQLLKVAHGVRQRHGFSVVRDDHTGITTALPMGLVARATQTDRGSRYLSQDRSIEVQLKRFEVGRSSRDIFEEILASPSLKNVSMKVVRRDAFFIAADGDRNTYYYTGRIDGDSLIGIGVVTPKTQNLQYQRVTNAIANAFHFGLPDYAAVISRIAPQPVAQAPQASPSAGGPQVYGWERRIAEPSAETRRASPLLPREALVPIVQDMMADAGIQNYRVLPPEKADELAVWWEYQEGGLSSLIAVKPLSGVTVEQVANSAVTDAAKMCSGEFATKRGKPQMTNGSEMLSVDAICKAERGAYSLGYVVVGLPSGMILRMANMNSLTAEGPTTKTESRRRMEEAVYTLKELPSR